MRGLSASLGADVLARDHFMVKGGEQVLLTADTSSDLAAAEAILSVCRALGADPVLTVIPQLPFQGKLADPYISDVVSRAALESDVWFDMTFPYMAGSDMHDAVMKQGKCRYMLLGDVDATGLDNLLGRTDLDAVFALQQAFDQLITSREGADCRVTNPAGTDVTFTLGKTVTKKSRRTSAPGAYTPLGSGIFYPVPETVKGKIVLDGVFHEFYTLLDTPMTLIVDGKIQQIADGGGQTMAMDRALRRAGGGEYGQVIHFTYGFHPTARFSGTSFIEDIRSCGSNAIGLGKPWWEPGGGENHPDAVVTNQSLWIDGEMIVGDGRIVGPQDVLVAADALGCG
ncbi:MAG: hypothetical protein JJ855_05100 [Rhodospirillales bacterium]|nr:hypothetical protein [Rhodospirillales bacterium]